MGVPGVEAAVVGGGGGGGSSAASLPTTSGDWFDYNWDSELGGQFPQWLTELESWFDANLAPMFATEERAIRSAFAIVAILIGISLLIGLLLALVRYPSETAVMRMVDDHSRTGNKMTFREGWRLGWDGRAWRLFIIDLLIGTPAFTLVMLLIGLIFVWVLALVRNYDSLLGSGAIAGIVIVVALLMLFGLFMWFVSLLRQYVARYATLEGTTVGESFRRGWRLFKGSFSKTFILGIIIIALGFGFGLVMMIAVFLLIPAFAVMALPGALVAALPGGLAYWIASLSAPQAVALIIAILVALPFFSVVVFSPLSFLGGMFAVYTSSVWTLAFRELVPVDSYPSALPFEAPPPLEFRIKDDEQGSAV